MQESWLVFKGYKKILSFVCKKKKSRQKYCKNPYDKISAIASWLKIFFHSYFSMLTQRIGSIKTYPKIIKNQKKGQKIEQLKGYDWRVLVKRAYWFLSKTSLDIPKLYEYLLYKFIPLKIFTFELLHLNRKV